MYAIKEIMETINWNEVILYTLALSGFLVGVFKSIDMAVSYQSRIDKQKRQLDTLVKDMNEIKYKINNIQNSLKDKDRAYL